MGVIWVSGLPGSGRSSVGRWLAGTIKPCVYVDGASLATAVYGEAAEGEGLSGAQGLIGTGGEVDLATLEGLRYKNSCLLADSFGEASINVVVDLELTGDALRQETLPQLRSRPFYLVQLLPSEKMVTGPGGLSEDLWRERRDRFRRQTPADGLWLDSSERDNGREVAQRILANLDLKQALAGSWWSPSGRGPGLRGSDR
jgi:hypothetical protein